jgi:hypothetical protein
MLVEEHTGDLRFALQILGNMTLQSSTQAVIVAPAVLKSRSATFIERREAQPFSTRRAERAGVFLVGRQSGAGAPNAGSARSLNPTVLLSDWPVH